VAAVLFKDSGGEVAPVEDEPLAEAVDEAVLEDSGGEVAPVEDEPLAESVDEAVVEDSGGEMVPVEDAPLAEPVNEDADSVGAAAEEAAVEPEAAEEAAVDDSADTPVEPAADEEPAAEDALPEDASAEPADEEPADEEPAAEGELAEDAAAEGEPDKAPPGEADETTDAPRETEESVLAYTAETPADEPIVVEAVPVPGTVETPRPQGVWSDEQIEAFRARLREGTATVVDKAAGAVIGAVNTIAAVLRSRTSERRDDGR
jgi:hypothetical protein